MTSRYVLPTLVGFVLVLVVIGVASSGRVVETELSLEERCSEIGGEWLYRSADRICLKADGTRLTYNLAIDAFVSPETGGSSTPVVLAAATEVGSTQVASANTCNQPPEFKDYQSDETFSGRPKVDFSTNDEARLYKTAISKDVARGVNFAGKYVVSTWGCGQGCVGLAVINAETGKILEYGLKSTGYAFEIESSLLDGRGLGYYSIQNDELIQVCN